MRKRWNKAMGILCYAAGVVCAVYVGGWLMLFLPITTLAGAISDGSWTVGFVLANLIKIVFSATIAGFLWCLGYIGYNHFKGTEDPDWEKLNRKE